MQELIDRIVATVGIEAAKASEATGIILKFLVDECPAELADRVIAQVPGGRGLIDAVPKSGNSLGAMFGSLLGGSGGLLGTVTALGAAGLDMGQIDKLAKCYFAFAEEKGGRPIVEEILAAVPQLKAIAR
ncbi:MAG: DUF2267 domain-containing protein [Ancalomicrobiaceae bacterium]|nr:DUF2267 domain-containing protein [Ancalomicrobiaceae bacterium]